MGFFFVVVLVDVTILALMTWDLHLYVKTEGTPISWLLIMPESIIQSCFTRRRWHVVGVIVSNVVDVCAYLS